MIHLIILFLRHASPQTNGGHPPPPPKPWKYQLQNHHNPPSPVELIKVYLNPTALAVFFMARIHIPQPHISILTKVSMWWIQLYYRNLNYLTVHEIC